MTDWGPLLTSVGGGGLVTALVAAGQWWSDERSHRRQEKRASAKAPLQQKSYELRIAEQAGQVAEETISTLRANLAALQGEFDKYKRDAEAQREKDMREAERLRRNDQEALELARREVASQREQIHDLNATVVRMEFELQRYRAGA